MLLIATMAVVIVSPASAADGEGTEYADWIRLHLPEAHHPDVEQALLQISETSARSFDEFLLSFFDELDRASGSDVESSSEIPQPQSSSRLAHELRLRFVRLVADAVLSRTLKAESFGHFFDSSTPRAFSLLLATTPDVLVDTWSVDELNPYASYGAATAFLLTAAQPLGP